MKLAMQLNTSNDETMKSNTKQVLKDFNWQSLATKAKKGEQLVSMMPAIIKDFDLLGKNKVDLSINNVS